MMVGALAGCATTEPGAPASKSLVETLQDDKIIALPYKSYGKGVYMIAMSGADGKSMNFAVDTGATQSALYESTVRRMKLYARDGAQVKVHGMTQYGARPVIDVPELSLGHKKYTNFRMAILQDRTDPVDKTQQPVGLIGMDILSDYRLFVDAENKIFNLIPKSLPAPKVPASWPTVQLIKNPYKIDDHDLHFLQIRLGNHLFPALLDTGSEDNLMNWNVEKFPQLRRARKRLREKWVIEGAVGSFDPHYMITTKNMRSGQKYWDDSQFIVMDFQGLDILGVTDKPFLIAGSALLSKETYYVDFAEDVIKFKPGLKDRRARSLTFTNTVYKGKDEAQ